MKKKFISLLVAFCLILGILPTAAFAADQTSADAGVRIHYVQDSYDESTGIFKVNVQAKLPNGTGITAMGAILSYDNTKLTLINQNNSSEIAGMDGEVKNPKAAAIKVLLAIEDEYGSKSEYSIANGDVYKSGDRSALYAYLYTQDAANAEKSSDNWIDCFQVSFKSSTSNPEEELDKLDVATTKAAEATVEIVKNGIDMAMNKFN